MKAHLPHLLRLRIDAYEAVTQPHSNRAAACEGVETRLIDRAYIPGAGMAWVSVQVVIHATRY
jgi:hypothetical protein